MHETARQLEEIAAISILAAGIIPADLRDGGADAVDAGRKIADRFRTSPSRTLYVEGLDRAAKLAEEKFGKGLSDLDDGEVAELLLIVREQNLPFFRQLRADTCAHYLSDPAVLQRIGFPGPSAATGGYPDFDQPQVVKLST